jgi:hypothetical protein
LNFHPLQKSKVSGQAVSAQAAQVSEDEDEQEMAEMQARLEKIKA